MLGIDKGTTYTKTDKGFKIKSTIREYQDDILLNGKNIVDYRGRKYVIGERGSYSTDLMKAEHDNTKLLILAAIGMSTKDNYINTDVVIGLPIGLYSKHKETMRNVFANDVFEISINGNKKLIEIGKVEVFPEAAGAFYSQSEDSALIVDIGGLSVDTALFEKEDLIKYSTYSMGIMKLYSKIANKLNSDFDLSLTEWDIEKVLIEGLKINGLEVELGVDYLIREHANEITERLRLEYDLKTLNVLLCGGGSQVLKDYMQGKVITDYQFANAKGFANIGKVII